MSPSSPTLDDMQCLHGTGYTKCESCAPGGCDAMLGALDIIGKLYGVADGNDDNWMQLIVRAVWHRRHQGHVQKQDAIPEEARDLISDLVGVELLVEPADTELAQRTRRELESLAVRQWESKRGLLKRYKLVMLTLAELVHNAEVELRFTGSFAKRTIATVRRRLKLDGG